MEKEKRKKLWTALLMLLLFVLWTVLISFVDVKPIGPCKSVVGFATLNGFFHNLFDTNMALYTITDWLGLVPIIFCLGFAFLGLIQLIKQKKLKNVDYNLFVLGGFYIVTMAVYILFEYVVINYRPILINNYLEASYPSSTTLLVLCIMPTAIMQLNNRIRNNAVKKLVDLLIKAFIVFMVISRLISGVHWLTDIIGGIILSTAIVLLYRFFVSLKE